MCSWNRHRRDAVASLALRNKRSVDICGPHGSIVRVEFFRTSRNPTLGGINSTWIPRSVASGKLTLCYWKSPFWIGKSAISMAIFNSYVSSPEGSSKLRSMDELNRSTFCTSDNTPAGTKPQQWSPSFPLLGSWNVHKSYGQWGWKDQCQPQSSSERHLWSKPHFKKRLHLWESQKLSYITYIYIYIIMYIYIYRDTYINMCLNHLEPLLPRALNFQHTSGHVDLVLVDLNKFLESRSRAALLVSAMAIQCSGAHELCRVVLI